MRFAILFAVVSLSGWASWFMGSWWRGKQEAAKLVKRAADLRGKAAQPKRADDAPGLLLRAFEAERAALVISGEVAEGGRR